MVIGARIVVACGIAVSVTEHMGAAAGRAQWRSLAVATIQTAGSVVAHVIALAVGEP